MADMMKQMGKNKGLMAKMFGGMGGGLGGMLGGGGMPEPTPEDDRTGQGRGQLGADAERAAGAWRGAEGITGARAGLPGLGGGAGMPGLPGGRAAKKKKKR